MMSPETQSSIRIYENDLNSSFEKMTAQKIEIIKCGIVYTNTENFYSAGMGFVISEPNENNLNNKEK